MIQSNGCDKNDMKSWFNLSFNLFTFSSLILHLLMEWL